MTQPQRLSSLEATFLALSTAKVSFIPGCVLWLDHPLALRVLQARIDALLADLPRYRQRIARAPLLGSRAWVDDEEFAVERHVGVVRVPAPGGERELDEVVAKLLTLDLPESHPPWRLWTVEGLSDGRGALIATVHHALVDGVAGIGLLERILRLSPELATDSVRVSAREPAPARPALERLFQRIAADLRGRAAAWRQLAKALEPRHHASALLDLLREGLHPASDLGLDGHSVSRQRIFSTFTVSLDETKAIKRAFDVTVNDVMLATISGAIRRYVARRGTDPDQLTDVRAMVPVSLHIPGERATSGNRVALLLAGIAVDAADARTRVRRIAETTKAHKQRDDAGAGDMLTALSDLTWSGLLTNVFRIALWRGAFNMVVTNVPGPPIPLYLLDARVTRLIPIVNLWPHIPIALAIGSYAGAITISIDVDRAVMPDLSPFVRDLQESFDELRAATAPRAAHTHPAA